MVNKVWDARVDELHQKDLISDKHKESLKKMVSSPDKQSVELAKEIMGSKMADELMKGLNEGQGKSFVEILDFFRNPQADAFVLKGYAGTGKTFLVSRVIQYIMARYPNRRIGVTAPTNKAVHVLHASAPFGRRADETTFNVGKSSDRIEYMTIHKLLGLREMITASGEQLFKSGGKNSKNEIGKFMYLIVDEVSMLDDTLCREILSHSDKVRILFMGDPAQIPPVNRADCIPFKEDTQYTFERAELTEIMRQKGDHPIVDASFHLRENLNISQPLPQLKTELNDKGHGIVYFHSKDDRPKVKPMLNEYFNTEEFKEDANYAKVIAWTNKTVNRTNEIIREILYGESPDPYMPGEKLIASKPIFEKVSGGKWGPQWNVQFNTSEEMVVEEVKVINKDFREGSHRLTMKMYQLKVKSYNAISKQYYKDFIRVVHEESVADYSMLMDEVKKKAVAKKEKELWVQFYNIQKWSAPVAYNYAITCHKAQGSTYKNVLLIEEDVDKNRKVLERNRIKYTAYTRPTDKLFILRDNYAAL